MECGKWVGWFTACLDDDWWIVDLSLSDWYLLAAITIPLHNITKKEFQQVSWLFGYEFLYIYLSAIHTGGDMLINQKFNRLFTSWIKSYLHIYFFWFYGEPDQDCTEPLYFSGVNR